MSIVNYCKANPLSNLNDGILDAVNQLLPPVSKHKR
jgi:hypothetical protein